MGNQVSTFLRLLDSPIPAKGEDLHQMISVLNHGQSAEDNFLADPLDFSVIPSTPFAYWAPKSITTTFSLLPRFESEGRSVRIGLSTSDDFRFLRLWWEVDRSCLRSIWLPLNKGGIFSQYFSDVHLLIKWANDGEEIKKWVVENPTDPGTTHWSRRIANSEYYFRPGLTWPRRTTSNIGIRILPFGCIFADKGPTVFKVDDNTNDLLALSAIMNSAPFSYLVGLQLGAATLAARSYEVGLIQRTPVPSCIPEARGELVKLASKAYELARQPSLGEEITHVFCSPTLLGTSGTGLAKRLEAINQAENQRQDKLEAIQVEIDARVAELYGVPELGRASAKQSWGDEGQITDGQTLDYEEDDEALENLIDPTSLVANLLMWCVGVAFGRWDVRYALDPSRLPELPGPFDPLPVCSPGMLTGSDDLPMCQDEMPADYPLPVAWDGFLVDAPDHPRDIVSSVERVLELIWPGKLGEVEREICEILGVPDLHVWFRDPKGFFDYHTKRYSKSRRKAPIYWLLQSAKRSYAIWLYYPRLNHGSLYHAGREYADAKLKLETGRLQDWQRNLGTASGSARKVQERKIADQEALVAELKDFVKALDAAALLELKPDLNDGVLLNISPLHELVPWKEAERTWKELLRGKYEWSSIGEQLRQKGLIKHTK